MHRRSAELHRLRGVFLGMNVESITVFVPSGPLNKVWLVCPCCRLKPKGPKDVHLQMAEGSDYAPLTGVRCRSGVRPELGRSILVGYVYIWKECH